MTATGRAHLCGAERAALPNVRRGFGSALRRSSRAAVVCAIALELLACAPKVVRISNGSTSIERAISPRAYSAYALARLQERNGDERAATASYLHVLQLDASADQAFIRLGAIACPHDRTAAMQAFAQAERIRANSAALLYAKADCARLHRDFATALAAADAGLRVAPADPEHSHLVIRIQAERGNRADALRYAWAHIAVFPNDTRGWLTLANIVAKPLPLIAQIHRRAANRIPSQHTALTVARLAPREDEPIRLDRTAKARIELEHAIATGDHRLAHRSARRLGLGILELSALASELGSLEFASELAALGGQIQPEDPQLWQRRLELADRLRDDGAFEDLLKHAPTTSLVAEASKPKSDVWKKLLDLVTRRTGVDVGSP